MTVSTRQLLPRGERQAQVLRAAARAFARSGYVSTSMEDVSAEAGVTKLIVYRHFDSKEELYRAVLTRVSERLETEFLAGLASDEPGFAVPALLTVAREDPDGFRLLWVHAAREPQFADFAADARAGAVTAADELVGVDLGDAPDRPWVDRMIASYVVESVLAWLDQGDPARDAEFVAEANAGLKALYETWVGPLG